MPHDETLDNCPQMVYNAINVKLCITQLGRGIMGLLKEKIKELRKQKGWAQEDMAREISVSLSTVQRWERQGGRPTRLARRELNRLFKETGLEWNENSSGQ